MAEELHIEVSASRKEKYESLLPQLKGLTEGEPDLIANISNIVAALKSTFQFFWVGVYFVKENELVLGPFQGTIACTRIAYGKGVCGACFKEKKTIIVPDVDAFPGHIACSSDSRSEIVVPVLDAKGNVLLVLDVDSDQLNDFSEVDQWGLENVAGLIQSLH
ncbi:MAG: GAF domain-containing protein [Flavobacteriales bacterium]|nr:GAF domain-containing protein [Flavobacteriales bacterium]